MGEYGEYLRLVMRSSSTLQLLSLCYIHLVEEASHHSYDRNTLMNTITHSKPVFVSDGDAATHTL